MQVEVLTLQDITLSVAQLQVMVSLPHLHSLKLGWIDMYMYIYKIPNPNIYTKIIKTQRIV